MNRTLAALLGFFLFLTAGCTPPPPIPFTIVSTEVALNPGSSISSSHVRGDYAREQGVDYVFIPKTKEPDEEAIANNREHLLLASTPEAHDFMLQRVQQGLQEAFARQAAEVGVTGPPARLKILVTQYDYNLGNAGFGAGIASAVTGVQFRLDPVTAYADRTSTVSGTAELVDPASGEELTPWLLATGRVHKLGIRVPGFEAVNLNRPGFPGELEAQKSGGFNTGV